MRHCIGSIVMAAVSLSSSMSLVAEEPPPISERAQKLHTEALLIDGHNDLPWAVRTNAGGSFDSYDIAARLPERLRAGQTDIPRLKAGGVDAQFWSVYVPADYAAKGKAAWATMEQIDIVHRMLRRYPETFELALTADDIERIAAEGRIASLIGVEGGHSIENSLGVLRMFHRLGARYMTLTHSETLDWADSASDAPRHGGLSPFGEEVVLEMNRLGMLVDISHVSAETMHDVLRVSRAPVIASHSSAFALVAHPRNVPDHVLRELPRNGGVVMVNFFSGFINPDAQQVMKESEEARRRLQAEHPGEADFARAFERWRREHPIPPGTLAQVVEHIDHIAQVAGIDHVGLGSDFDGVSRTPAGLEDVSRFPAITQALLDRGYSDEAVRKVLGQNVLRVMRGAEQAAGELQAPAAR
jgi:membrane dipeptidase